MTLQPGTRLGAYEILGPLGAGGMGEVYRARDPRLERDVAVKTLPASFSADPDRLRRFEQEARATAALNHPNILVVYDIGSHEGAPYVVSELLEGETLRDRLTSAPAAASESASRDAAARGGGTLRALTPYGSGVALPVRKAVEYAVQIARGLAAAHEKNVVHRDLKPENLLVTTEGRVKILDFGLAKLAGTDVASGPADATVAGFQTEPGIVLGTVGYMAPEQVRGLPVDHRADIFAFGTVLYEMLAGRRAFQGATAADTIAAVVKEDPPDLPAAERHIPPALARIVDRCLEKNPVARFQTASDLAFALESLSSSSDRTEIGSVTAPTAPPSRQSRERLAWIAAAALGLALLGTGIVAVRHLREAPAEAIPVHFAVEPPTGTIFVGSAPAVVSPDGQSIVFALTADGVTSLRVRRLANLEAQPLAGTQGATHPFWSPDSRSIAFFAGGQLRTMTTGGGSPVAVCDAQSGGGGAWAPDNTIVFAPTNGPFQKVPASGGTPVPVTSLGQDETAHRWPWFLPDGRRFLYVSVAGPAVPAGTMWIGSLDSNERTRVGPSNSQVLYVSGYLLYARNGSLVAHKFDIASNEATGETIVVAQPVTSFAGSMRAAFSASETGVLTYRTGGGGLPSSSLTWFDRSGKVLGVVGDRGSHINLAIAANDRRLAVSRASLPANIDIWLLDLAPGGAMSRLTSDPAAEFDPTWAPDGSAVVFTSSREKQYDMYRRAANGTGQDERVAKLPLGVGGPEWSPDGKFLAYEIGGDIGVLPLSGDPTPTMFIRTSFSESDPAFSPDGRWLAYTSNESGRPEVHMQSFPAPGGKHIASRAGGREARWRGDGRELFFLAPDGTMMATAIDTTNGVDVKPAQPLFRTGIVSTQNNHPYVVTRDGQRFLMPVPEQTAGNDMTVVLNWISELAK